MEITWYGHSCFRLVERGFATSIMDPFDSKIMGGDPLHLSGNIVTISHNKPGHNYVEAVSGSPHVVNGPGEYEIGEVFITGVQTNEEPMGESAGNVLYLFDYNGINVAHLGGLNRVPSQTEVEDLGPVHVLLLPIGGQSNLDAAKASEVVALFEPNIVIPMHYNLPEEGQSHEALNKFLKQMGIQDELQSQNSLKIPSVTSLPEEMRVIVLERQPSER